MTTWTTISNAAVAVGGIPSSSTVTALRDNVSAAAESASGAPINVTGWHPVDKITVGDGKTGLIYDFSVNGAVSSVVTPDFVDGYEYRMIGHGLSHSSSTSQAFYIEGYKETSAQYVLFYADGDHLNNVQFACDAEFLMPRLSTTVHFLRLTANRGGSFAGVQNRPESSTSPDQKILRGRIRFSDGNIDSGKVWVFRRREYASSP